MLNTGNGYRPISDSHNNLFYNMKTILEWLNEAKEQGYDWAEVAINNYIRQWAYASPKNKVNSLVRALEVAFLWSDSPEKEAFWHGVSEILRAAEEGYSVASPTNAVNPTSLEFLIKDLGKLNSALENLEYNGTLKEPYRSQFYDATKASYKEQIDETKAEIAKMLGIKPQNERKLIGWVVQSEDGGYSKCTSPDFIKDTGEWFKFLTAGWTDITPEEAIALCGRMPEWSDNEPTPIYE